MIGYGQGFLKPYRVIDLTDHRGLLAGHMLAQMGADVVQVEPEGGNIARQLPPFAPDWPESEQSLFWATYAAGKRSIVADPEGDGALWERLLRSADILIESYTPREGRPFWLDPGALAERHPHLVHVSITPFGLEGPKHDWQDSEITLWAAGGPLWLTRGHDDRPLRISVPQAYLHAGATAVSAALIALTDRSRTGRGQHVDLAVVQTLPQCTLGAVLAEGGACRFRAAQEGGGRACRGLERQRIDHAQVQVDGVGRSGGDASGHRAGGRSRVQQADDVDARRGLVPPHIQRLGLEQASREDHLQGGERGRSRRGSGLGAILSHRAAQG
ncbi:CoA transferase [Sphingobium ummariense]